MTTLHIVSHTHWDREWFETFQQFRLKLVRMVDDLLDLLENDPDYRHFMLDGQMIVLEDYLAVRPEREEDLRQYIQAGRIVIGPWYILPDEFLVSPEATIRNLYEGDRTAQRFGSKMEIGYLPDTFGHIGQMPQILRGYGFDKACAWRGIADLPCEFWWAAPDGSRVLMGHLRDSYSCARNLTGEPVDRFIEEVRRVRDMFAPYVLSDHMLLMNGDDFMVPQPGLGKAVAACGGKVDEDVLLHSTLPAYFAGVAATIDGDNLPVVTGELRSPQRSNLLPNMLSTRIWIKQRNHACETLLEKWAEPFSTWAVKTAGNDVSIPLVKHPAAVLRQAWRLLMQCHPHDSICGCSIDQVHEEMRPRFDQAEQIGEALTWQSLQTLAGVVDTSTGMQEVTSSIVVFNPTQTARTDTVKAAFTGLKTGQPFLILDEKGNPQPYALDGWEEDELASMTMPREEWLQVQGAVNNGEIQGFRIVETNVWREADIGCVDMVVNDHGRPNLAAWEHGQQQIETLLQDSKIQAFRVKITKPVLAHTVFTPSEVPGLGFRTFWAKSVTEEQAETTAGSRTEPSNHIENEFFSADLHPDGSLNLRDKSTGVVYSGLNRFVDVGDRGDEYSFSASEDSTAFQPKMLKARVQHSQIEQTLEIELELEVPARLNADRATRTAEHVRIPIKSWVRLYQGVPRVDIHTEIDNRAEDHRLRVHFPAPIQTDTALHDGHFEIIERPIGLPQAEGWFEQPCPQVPQRAFTAIQDDKTGLLIVNKGLPEVEALQNEDGHTEVALTLLRCVGWLSRGDFPERGGHAGPGMPTPGAQMMGKWSFDYAVVPFASDQLQHAIQQAYDFQAPMRAASTGLHEGKLPASASLLDVEPQTFVISAVKAAEDGQGWIVRGCNLNEEKVSVRLRTLLPFDTAERVDLAEKPIEPLTAEGDGSVRLQARGKEIVTVRFH